MHIRPRTHTLIILVVTLAAPFMVAVNALY